MYLGIAECRYLYAQGNNLRRKFSNCNFDVKIKLFKTYCTSIYSGQLWSRYKTTSMNKVKVAYNSILRIFLDLPRFFNNQVFSISRFCVEYNIITFHALVRKYIFRFMERVSACTHTFICKLVDSVQNTVLKSRLWNHWRAMLSITEPDV